MEKYTPSTQHETTSQLLGRSWLIYFSTFRKVFFLSLVLSIIAFIPRVIALIAKHDIVADLPLLSPHQLWLLLIYIVDLSLFMAILWRLQCVTTGAHESLSADLSMGFRKVPLIIGAAFIQFCLFAIVTLTLMGLNVYVYQQGVVTNINLLDIVIIGFPAILQMIFCVYAFYLLYFYFPIILTENQGIFASLIKSAKLVWGHWWKAFWPITIPWIIYVLVLMAFKAMGFDMHIYFFEAHKLTISATVLHIVIFAIFIPWFAATALVVLRDLELRQNLPKIPRARATRAKKKTLKSSK